MTIMTSPFLQRQTPSRSSLQGITVSGNVALASNGTKVTGPHHGLSTINDGKIGDHAKTYVGKPCLFTLPAKYRLNKIRILLWRFGSRATDTNWRLVTVQATNNRGSEVGIAERMEHHFQARPVKYIRVTGTHNPAGDGLRIEELEAYCEGRSSHIRPVRATSAGR